MRIEQKKRAAPSTDYVERVNRAIDHVVQALDRPHRLEDVAEVAGFSPFHFHRVFRSLVGETLQQFVNRVRLERALFLMSHDPARSLTEVALACGFGSSSNFTRCFRQRYGVAPSAFDLAAWRAERGVELRGLHLERLPPGENPDGFEVTLRELPARTVAYLRVPDPYGGRAVVEASERLLAWAEARGLADGAWLGYMWDDPELVDLSDCRYDVGVVVDDPRVFEPGDGIGRIEFPSMTVAEVEVRGGIDLELRALDWLFGTWLPASGRVPDDQPCFEAWMGRPFAHGEEHFELCAHLPVRIC